MTGRLEGKTALLTGAGGELGNAITRVFLAEGARGVMATDVRPEPLAHLSATATSGGELVLRELDVTDGEAFEALARQAFDRWDGLDIIVNNAGMVPPNARVHNIETPAWAKALEVNLTGTFHGVRAAARVMRPRPGVVVNVASISAMTAWPYASPYCAAKAGVVHFTRVAALEYAKEGLRVNCVCPGAFPSEIHKDLPDGTFSAIEARHPLGRGTAMDVVGAVIYLASDEARWTTGHALVVDGGYSLP